MPSGKSYCPRAAGVQSLSIVDESFWLIGMALGNSNSPVCNHSPNLAQQSSDSTLNVFEGPEKKLEMHFKRSTVGKRLHTCQTADRCNSLRNLRRCDIEAILRAAACNILSVAKNEHTDAYLLSESSLFVSDTCLTLKTCGTTRLLLALPVILKLVSDKLALLVTYVQFSRVSYILPDAQLFPHDSIANEVSFLDRALNTKGRVFQAPLFSSSWWYMYSTTLAPCAGRGGKLKNTESQDEKNCETLDQKQALELYMFDLDPSAMKQFMFGDRPRMWGRDTIADGTTSLVGIDKLLLDGATIDAFNFKPCGYSMNAMHDRSYYTIHVSPEPDASYVSFETTASHRNISKLITSVVKLFKPSRFTVAIIPNPTNGCSMSGREEHQLSMMNKHMLTQSFCAAASNVFSVDERSHAIVSSFLSVENWTRPISPSSIFDELSEHEDVVKRLNTVGRAHNAHFIEDYESSPHC
ncbi:unnamed protein product [Chondrus crispus]|uniref:Uncharacterized protein n=1 Tax=Chondrus crispus TaxID=2769 RepID=R7Q777_CHOCR|nr:unnamed protein product [Chondrus crispus]CDF33874.1 unnamed protein product [Chondrus crispus]|eukprot:XP_005713693.1 unnamed protein product [Chondrus crispus]